MAMQRRIVVTQFGGSGGSEEDEDRDYSRRVLAKLIENARSQVSYFVDIFDAHSKVAKGGRLVEHLLDANAIIHAFTRALRAIRKLPIAVREHPTALVAIMSFEQAAFDISYKRSFTLENLIEATVDVFQPGDLISTFTVKRWHSVRRQLEIAAADIAAETSNLSSPLPTTESLPSEESEEVELQDDQETRELQSKCKMRVMYSDGVFRGGLVRLWQIDGIGAGRSWLVQDDDRRIQTLIHSHETWMLLDRYKKPKIIGEERCDSLFDPDSGPTVLRPSEALQLFKSMQFAPPSDLFEDARREVEGVLPGWSASMAPIPRMAKQLLEYFGTSTEVDRTLQEGARISNASTEQRDATPNSATTGEAGMSSRTDAAARTRRKRATNQALSNDTMAAAFLIKYPTSSTAAVAKAIGMHPSNLSPSKKHRFPEYWRAKATLAGIDSRFPRGKKVYGCVEAVVELDEEAVD